MNTVYNANSICLSINSIIHSNATSIEAANSRTAVWIDHRLISHRKLLVD